MRRFLLGWKILGHQRRLRAKIVNYADDFVICCRGSADEAMAVMRDMMQKLKLTINEEKTRKCRLPDETFNFLSYTFGRCYSPRTGRAYYGTRPSKMFPFRFSPHPSQDCSISRVSKTERTPNEACHQPNTPLE